MGLSRPKMTFFRHKSAMPKATSSPDKAPAEHALPASYEEAVQELEQLLAKLESGQLLLDQLLSHYQRGASLLAYCRERLAAIENQINVLDEGTLKPWDGA
jgi:exodeoxyribonuclease VII small subunit